MQDNMRQLDIRYRTEEPFNRLSNFYPNSFLFEGEAIKSMEGFLQSLKFKNEAYSRSCMKLAAGKAKKRGKINFHWRFRKKLYWKGRQIDRFDAQAYMAFLAKAYDSMFAQHPELVKILLLTEGKELTHSIGSSDPNATVLTQKEFIYQLERIKQKYAKKG